MKVFFLILLILCAAFIIGRHARAYYIARHPAKHTADYIKQYHYEQEQQRERELIREQRRYVPPTSPSKVHAERSSDIGSAAVQAMNDVSYSSDSSCASSSDSSSSSYCD